MSNSVSQALQEAEKKSGKKIVELVKKEDEGELMDLSQFGVEEKSAEELEAERKEVERRDQWCRSAAPIIIATRKRVNEILVLMQNGPLSIPLQAELDGLRKKEQTLLAAGGDKSLADHLTFSVFLDEVRMASVSKEMAKVILARVVELGRYFILPQEEAEKKKKEWREAGKIPQGVQILYGWVYMPYEPAAGEVKSRGQMALESTLDQYMYKVRQKAKRPAEK
jgi:hypothetical protein